uniref:Letm1 RBD domain-containing protein n=1 Tax=Paramoeba aestuarina TaxID=180227 RepID=A0A7S4NXP1_9EUKA|mmetsp:Transcript_30738/g.47858  ORF Transcript_30738/g.47858 Transcript_30738/m.47858 type:complete len:290 (+) Transcript_30738:140-1009(+)
MKRDAMLMRRGYQDSGLFASLFLILTFPVGTLFGLGYHVVASRSFPRSLPGFFQTPRTHIHERAKSLDKRSQARMELIHTFHAFLERDNHSLEDVGEISLGLLEISKKIQNNERVTLDDMVAIMPLLTDPNYQKHELDDNEQLIYAKILDLPTDSLLLRRGTSMYNTVLNSLIEAFMKDDYILDLVGIDKLSDSEIIWSCERRGIWVDGEDEFDIGGDEARTSYLPFKDEAERIEEMRAVLKDWITISRTIVQFEFAASVPPEEWKEFMVEKKPLLTKTFMGALGLLHG